MALFAGGELASRSGVVVELLGQAGGAANRPAMATHSPRHGAASGR